MDGTNGVEWWKSSTTLSDVIDYATYETSHPTSDQLNHMLTAELHGNTHWFLDVDMRSVGIQRQDTSRARAG